jgi:excisionase family DNA binding protein
MTSVAVREVKLLSFAEAAERIGCSQHQLRKIINCGEGPPWVSIGRDRKFRGSTIDKWLAQRELASRTILKRNKVLAAKFLPVR